MALVAVVVLVAAAAAEMALQQAAYSKGCDVDVTTYRMYMY
jgi:hypothetical protein